jgi:hypothetical protein
MASFISSKALTSQPTTTSESFIYGNGRGYSYAEISPVYYFDEDQHFSVGLTYKVGNTTPDFRNVNSVNAFFGVKF